MSTYISFKDSRCNFVFIYFVCKNVVIDVVDILLTHVGLLIRGTNTFNIEEIRHVWIFVLIN